MSWRNDYEAIDALNYSNAKRLLRSGKHFKEGHGPAEETEHIIVGALVHAMILEGKDLRKTYAIKPPKMSFATTLGKQWRDAQTLPILADEASERIPRMADAIAKNKFARAFIRMCPLREHILTGTINGVRCKGMVDMVGHDDANNPGFCEIKTLPDCRKRFFTKRIVTEPFFYDGQIVWYRRLLAYPVVTDAEHSTGQTPALKIWSVWIACENRAPFDVAVYPPSDEMLASGEERVRDIFVTYHSCLDAKSWPGVQPGEMEPISPPRWRLREMQSEYDEEY